MIDQETVFKNSTGEISNVIGSLKFTIDSISIPRIGRHLLITAGEYFDSRWRLSVRGLIG